MALFDLEKSPPLGRMTQQNLKRRGSKPLHGKPPARKPPRVQIPRPSGGRSRLDLLQPEIRALSVLQIPRWRSHRWETTPSRIHGVVQVTAELGIISSPAQGLKYTPSSFSPAFSHSRRRDGWAWRNRPRGQALRLGRAPLARPAGDLGGLRPRPAHARGGVGLADPPGLRGRGGGAGRMVRGRRGSRVLEVGSGGGLTCSSTASRKHKYIW